MSQTSEVVFDGPELPYHCKTGQKPSHSANEAETHNIPCTNACRALSGDISKQSIQVLQVFSKFRILIKHLLEKDQKKGHEI